MGTIVVLLSLIFITFTAFIVGAVKPKIITQQADANRGYKEESIPVRKVAWLTSAGFALLTVISLFFSTFTIISATQVGVPVSFGKVGTPLEAGVHFKAPWAKIESYPTRPVTVELSGQDAITARTADAGQMTVEVAVRWRVEPDKAKVLYFQSRSDNLKLIDSTIILPNLRQAVGQIYSVTGNLDAISDRERVATAIHTQLSKQLAVYGIDVDTVQMRKVEPDKVTASTISQFASQQQATRIATEAKKTAVIEAERRLIESKGLELAGKSIANLTPTQLQVICMQVWQQVNASAITHGATIYTQPCGSNGSLIVNTK